ncbi:NF-kappa-B-repressing factor-like [Toxorhynchites rutilus septentrionalis]|uniref:NF-kappa-B-repressing factor-like n=1 Tax=Toxorhynchites rutilus septentrionalis TaxID=329112 RepID=UPI002478CE76|nr:NF-kappa-B-repressing factor-like [Toxorhynchites rutilus septentrionalis]
MFKHKPQLETDEQECKKQKIADAAEQQDANTNWSIDAYRTRYEPEEHWDLRRTFMDRHQHWIPEDELVCLAQVFVNVELLHCRYPLETMERIKELAGDIANGYRAMRRNKLQRTFVSASDAAASKVQKKGPFQPSDGRQFKPIVPIRTLEDVYNNIVIMNNDYEQTQMEFGRLGCGQLELTVSKESGGKNIGEIRFKQFLLAKAVAAEDKPARKAVKREFLTLMSEHCYQIIRKSVLLSNVNVERKAVDGAVDHRGRSVAGDFKEKKIDESNLGFKLLQKLGWAGGSLGTKSEGIVDPINCQIKIGRKGLGATAASQEKDGTKKGGKIDTNKETFGIDVNFYRQTMRNFRDSGIQYDMVFSNEFTKEERALFHRMAQELQLKTRSYGKDDDGSRQFVLLARKLPAHELLERILVGKDPIFCEMYEIHHPNKNKNDSQS